MVRHTDVSCVHHVAVLNAAFCMTCSMLMLVGDARGDHMEEAYSRVGLSKIESARVLAANGRRYKFFWQGCNKGTAGVGVFIAERWIDSVVNVVRVNEQIMYVKLVIGKQIVNIVSAYAPQVGLSAEEKDDFWDSFIIVLSGIPKQESIFIGSDMIDRLNS